MVTDVIMLMIPLLVDDYEILWNSSVFCRVLMNWVQYPIWIRMRFYVMFYSLGGYHLFQLPRVSFLHHLCTPAVFTCWWCLSGIKKFLCYSWPRKKSRTVITLEIECPSFSGFNYHPNSVKPGLSSCGCCS